ncbi:MAG: hypothetical protein AB2814_00565 [Candidatus Sedimenticola endophacoides]|nr:hypothetical protein [Shewanella sp.]
MTQSPIPGYWTPEQALAVYEFIDELRDALWARYEVQLIEQMQHERVSVFEVEEDVTF